MSLQAHPTARISPLADLEISTRGTVYAVGANSVIAPGVQIGRDCVIGANVSVAFALIGDRVKLYAGARIGEAGFGATGTAAEAAMPTSAGPSTNTISSTVDS